MDETNAVTPHCAYVYIKGSLLQQTFAVLIIWKMILKLSYILHCSCFGFYKFPIVHNYYLHN